jgi:hypothetical protein
MPDYCVDKMPARNGDHEVHRYECPRAPVESRQEYLGMFSNCRDAVRTAKKIYVQANGCAHCSPDCHVGPALSLP